MKNPPNVYAPYPGSDLTPHQPVDYSNLAPPVDPYPHAPWVPPQHPVRDVGWNTVTADYQKLTGPAFTTREWDVMDMANSAHKLDLANQAAPTQNVLIEPTRQLSQVIGARVLARTRFTQQPPHPTPWGAPMHGRRAQHTA